MNKNIVEFETKKVKGLFVSVPYSIKVNECFFKDKESVRFALMIGYGTDCGVLSFVPIVIPKGNYKIIGLSNEINEQTVIENLGITFREYIQMLNKQDITVNYSDYSNMWLVLIKIDNNNNK